MSERRPSNVSTDPNQKLNEVSREDQILFLLSAVSQFMHSPHEKHMDVMYKILRYLKALRENVYCSEKTIREA